MTIEQMHDALAAECKKHEPLCSSGEKPCSMMGEPVCAFNEMSDEEIHGLYYTVFGKPPVTEDIINHPKHYNREGAMESIDEMLLLFGKDAVKHFCLCNAWKYRYRAADKNGEEDMKKSDWYIAKYKELCENVRKSEYQNFYNTL